METVHLQLPTPAPAAYDVFIGHGLIHELGPRVRQAAPAVSAALISDSNVAPLYLAKAQQSLEAAGYRVICFVFPAGEAHKTFATSGQAFDALFSARVERATPVVALGGGVVGDLAGFVSAAMLRGTPFIQAPTTLLAAVDASVGGKVGVDHAAGKNLIGAFHQPRLVLTDVATFASLPVRELRCGLAECIKHGIIRDASLFRFIERQHGKILAGDPAPLIELIRRNVEIKARIVMEDPFEHGVRALLNLGHTFGHAIENVYGYRDVQHGEAVALGMVAAAALAGALGKISADDAAAITRLIADVGLPTTLADLDVPRILAPMYTDKKVSGGRLRLIIPTGLGRAEIVTGVPDEKIAAAIAKLSEDPPELMSIIALDPQEHRMPVSQDRLIAWMRLARVPGFGPVLVKRVVEALGSPEAALGAPAGRLAEIEGIGRQRAEAFARGVPPDAVQRELDAAARKGVRILCADDADWPPGLRRIPDPPIVLYLRGKLEPTDAIAVGIVGSRKCTLYGREQAERFGALLAQAGVCVVSGGARGIDTGAHPGALRAKGRTIVVQGCGAAFVYPEENADLYDRIADGNGAVLSELPLDVSPKPENFPPRNRIIAGMSLGILVIEATLRSGSLITARLAADDYGREVFALPGRVDVPTSAGTHHLIKIGGASLVESADDILAALGELGSELSKQQQQKPVQGASGPQASLAFSSAESPDAESPTAAAAFTAPQQKILAVFDTADRSGVDVDMICDHSGLPASVIMAELTMLQIRGAIRRALASDFTAPPGQWTRHLSWWNLAACQAF